MQLIDSLTSEKDVLISTLEAMKNGKELCIIEATSAIDGIMNEDFSETSKHKIGYVLKSVFKHRFIDQCNFFKLGDRLLPLSFSMVSYKNNPLMKAINKRYKSI